MNQGEIVKTKAMTLSFQNLEEYSSFITAPQSSRGLLEMRTFITGAAKNHLGKEQHLDYRPRVAAPCCAAWFAP